ncbi:MAG: SDR family oxidoreductase [Clostridiales Family XIII bacterium]|jgi:NAD(P)-dependent dehydrogenase (short-subunit alcohol dehydrogenase family)|nr:SDR family oxidoreductase [Clostridiales Family XIII bacterium]
MMVFDFSGKNALVTGAGSGIGRAVALQFAEAGANVWVGDISGDNAAGAVAEMGRHGGSYGFTVVDVSRKDDLTVMFAGAARAFGRIDIVVNSAGVFMTRHLIEATPEEIKRHLDINLMGAVYGCQLALETMIRQGGGGKIVNIASVGGRHGELDFPYYALGKAGVLNWTQSVAYNAAPHGINCNAVCPGIIRTPMWESILEAVAGEGADRDALFDEMLKSRTPLGRAQTGEEMAYAVLFLSSGYADAIVGQALNVCGGSVMS